MEIEGSEPGFVLDDLCRSPIATVVTDPQREDNPIVAVNAAFEQLTGYSAAEAVGRNCRFLAAEDKDQAGMALMREAIGLRRAVLAAVRNYRRDGTLFRNAVMVAPLYDTDGNLRYFVGSQMEVPARGFNPDHRKEAAQGLIGRLTPRQRQVLHEMMLGYRNKQIADRLRLSVKTVKMHRSDMLARLDAVSSTDAVRIAVEAGLQPVSS